MYQTTPRHILGGTIFEWLGGESNGPAVLRAGGRYGSYRCL